MARRLVPFEDAASGIIFYFAIDRDDPSRFHVEARGTSIEAAIIAFFEAESTVWNANNRRFETMGATHGIYWVHYAGRSDRVLIISCFERA